MNQPLFREEALNHQRERLWGDVILTQPLSMAMVTIAIVLTLVALVAYLVLGTYTRKETVQGYLVPEAGLVQVHPAQAGTVSRLHVQSGDAVEQGDVLVDVETDRSLGNGDAVNALLIDLLEQQETLLQQRIERQYTRKARRKDHLESRIANSKAEIAQLESQKELQHERLALARDQYESLRELHEEQLISENRYQEHYQRYLDERQKLQQLDKSLISERASLQSAEFELASLGPETAEEIDRLKAKIARLDQQSVQYKGERSYSIEAPISGRITSLQIAPGQNIGPRRPVLAILPKDEQLQAELLVPTRAIGFVETGLDVEMRYDAFPYERFGVYDSHIERVAKTVLSPREVSAPLEVREPVYRATASLNRQDVLAYGQNLPLQSGMTFEADILLDERPLYQWILKPLYALEGAL
ncbi:HlyD family secretion protein [Arhodomonas sp. AD133]|uniref:HlyD family secretion protein n=1 Tax=Arhodomonas sp. AD133 TaxID=3415009 RepID=UPI003EB72922